NATEVPALVILDIPSEAEATDVRIPHRWAILLSGQRVNHLVPQVTCVWQREPLEPDSQASSGRQLRSRTRLSARRDFHRVVARHRSMAAEVPEARVT